MRLLSLVCLLGLGAACLALPPGKERNAMKQQFADPPAHLRPLQITHGLAGVQAAGGGELGAGLDRLREQGLGGVVANVAWQDYLRSEPAWATFLAGYRAARERGLEFWIYDEEGYPSGAAGHLVLEGNPEYEACGLICLQASVPGSRQAALALPEAAQRWVYACALPLLGTRPRLEGAAAVPVPAGREAVAWRNPTDHAHLLLGFAQQVMYEGTHCTSNVFAKRRYINILDPAAVAKFIRLTHDAYAQRLGEGMRQVRAVFTDEPSLMTSYMVAADASRPPALPWEASLPEHFQQRAGYPLLPSLPALFLELGRDSRRVRGDFYRVLGERVAETFFGQIQERCRQLGLAASGHVLCEERLDWHVAFEGDLFAALRRMDLPGVDVLNSQPEALMAGDGFLAPKLVASAAHLVGSPRVMSETSDFVQRMQQGRASLEQMLATAALQYALGVNLITSYYPWQAYGEEELSWLQGREGAARGYRAWSDFVGRLGVLMVGGSHCPDLACYYPIETVQAYFRLTDQPYHQEGCHGPEAARCQATFRDQARGLLQHQYDFDVVDRQAVLAGRVRGGRLEVGGERYPALVFPGARVLPVAVLERALELQRGGGVVAFAGALPQEAPDPQDDPRVADLLSRLLAAGAMVVPEGYDLAPALGPALPPAVALAPACPTVVACRRRQQGREVTLLVNYDHRPASFRLQGVRGRGELWWPDRGEIQPVPNLAARTIALHGYQAVFVVR